MISFEAFILMSECYFNVILMLEKKSGLRAMEKETTLTKHRSLSYKIGLKWFHILIKGIDIIDM